MVLAHGPGIGNDEAVSSLLTLTRFATPSYSTPGLRRFTRAHSIAAAGDAFITVSLAGSLFFSVSPDASRTQVLTYLIVTMAPFAVLAPLIGPAIDRFRRGHRWIAVMIYLVRAALCIALAFALFSVAFFFIALVLLVANKASGVLKSALIPGLIDDPVYLVAANSRLARVTTLVGGTGGAIAAGLAATTSSAVTLYGAAVLFVISASIAARLPRPHRTDPDPDDEESLLHEFENEHRPVIAISATAYTVIRFAVGAFVFGLAFALRRASEPAWMYGLAVVAYGVGAYGGNILAPLTRRRFGEDRLIAGALIGLTVAVAIAAAGGSRIMVVFVSAVMGAATTFGRQGFDSMVQRYAPLALHAQSFSRFETQYQLAWVVGGTFATAIAVSARISLALLIAILVPASLLYLRTVTRARRLTMATATAALLEPGEVAEAHLMAAERWLESPHRHLALIELNAALELCNATGWETPDDVADQIQRLRSAANGSLQLDHAIADNTVRELIHQMRQFTAS